jgi:hypothetical protein
MQVYIQIFVTAQCLTQHPYRITISKFCENSSFITAQLFPTWSTARKIYDCLSISDNFLVSVDNRPWNLPILACTLASRPIIQKNKPYWRNEEGTRFNSRNVLFIKLRSGKERRHIFCPFICLAATSLSTSPPLLQFVVSQMSFRFSLCILSLLLALADGRRAVEVGERKETSGQVEKIHHTCSFFPWPKCCWNIYSLTKFFLT